MLNRTTELDRLYELIMGFTDDALREEVLAAVLSGADDLPDELTKDGDNDTETSQNLFGKIREMTVPQKVKLALFGNQAARQILLRDSNRMVPMFVLQNPRMSETELGEIARNTNLDEQILRTVGNNTTWMKNYSMKASLVGNPKTPIDVALRWLKHLNSSDLKKMAKSKNIPQVIASQAKKLAEKGD